MKLHLSLIAAALLTTGAAHAETADDIVKKHIAAIGGVDAWKKVTSLKMTGTMSGGGMDIPMSMQKVKDKGMRVDFEVQEKKNYQILTPTEGWMYMPIMGQTSVQPIPAEQVTASQGELQIGDNLIDYAAKGSKVELEGTEKAAGAECYKLKVTTKGGEVVTDYIDTKTYYLLRVSQKAKGPDGNSADASTDMSDYKKLPEGIVVPMTIASMQGPISLSKIEVNTIKDDSIFKPDTK